MSRKKRKEEEEGEEEEGEEPEEGEEGEEGRGEGRGMEGERQRQSACVSVHIQSARSQVFEVILCGSKQFLSPGRFHFNPGNTGSLLETRWPDCSCEACACPQMPISGRATSVLNLRDPSTSEGVVTQEQNRLAVPSAGQTLGSPRCQS